MGEEGEKKKKGRFGDVSRLVETYCKDWEDSPLDIATFFFCLAAFSKPKLEKKKAIFDEALILDAYHYSQFAFAAYKGDKKHVLERLPFLEEEDYIEGNWDKTELVEAPAWYVVLDRDEKNVILGLRGTKEAEDILVDLAAQFVKWRTGFCHHGFLKSLSKLEPFIKDLVADQMQKNPGYSLRVCGHSMGAAVAALLCIKWHDDFPDWDIRGYGYATPCCVSAALSKESEPYFTTFVHHFDAVTRLSMGSIQDLHNGMRTFVSSVGKNNNALAVLRAMNQMALNSDNKKIMACVADIDKKISANLQKQLTNHENPTHLFPAGKTYQLWREKRGRNFNTWQMYESTTGDYGRLQFSRSMLADHGSVGYNNAFENMLSISVTERRIWLSINKSKREAIREYWNSFPTGDVFAPEYDTAPAVENMKKESKHKSKALKEGLIRPFLYLVSMGPRRRAALADMMGISLVGLAWYTTFDCHREAWHILTCTGKGVRNRSNSSARTVNPLAKNSNWWMVLYGCGAKVKKTQKKYIPKDVKRMLRKKNKGYSATIKSCVERNNDAIRELEEIVHLLFFSLTDGDLSAEKMNAAAQDNADEKEEEEEDEEQDEAAEQAEAQELQQERQAYANDPVYQETVAKMEAMGFTVERFIHKMALHCAQASANKKANEVYSWGDVVRREDERWKKREVAGMGALGLLSAALFLGAAPMLVVAPPLALVPLGLGIGIGGVIVTKATPGGLVSFVAGCLQQRLALAFHDIAIDDYYI